MKLGLFYEIPSMSPHDDLADDAQFWIGECYYGLGKYGQAVAEYGKVAAYSRTDRADDAQIRMAYCYLSRGDRARALEVVQAFLVQFPESEFTVRARWLAADLTRP